jgi:predicted HTH transcriptional regulator
VGSEYVAEHGNITNQIYQDLFGVRGNYATRDIKSLKTKGILVNQGTKGSSAVYGLA